MECQYISNTFTKSKLISFEEYYFVVEISLNKKQRKLSIVTNIRNEMAYTRQIPFSIANNRIDCRLGCGIHSVP